MTFEIIKEEEFRSFLQKHPLRTFLQTPEIAHLRVKSGWDVHYVAIFKKRTIQAATMVLSKKTHFGKREFYAPRGLLVDYEDKELLTFFIQELKKYVKKHHGYVLRMDPYIPRVKRDTSGEVVEKGVNNTHIIKTIMNLGFKQKKHPEQAQWMYVLDVENKTKDDILKNMKYNTRNTIKKTMKTGIIIEELAYQDLDEFYQIMEKTGTRKNFEIRDLDYFQKMYKEFHPRGEIKFLMARIELEKYIDIISQEIETHKKKHESLCHAAANEKECGALQSTIESLEKKIVIAKEIMDKEGKIITLSGSMFIMIDPEIVYLSSGNYEDYLFFNAQYLIQWEMIQYAIDHHFKRYNFYGISGNFDKKDPYYGVYNFKKGFNGYVEELIGEYALPVSFTYYLFNLLHKIRS